MVPLIEMDITAETQRAQRERRKKRRNSSGNQE
jgi:hypothetical protein